MKNALKLFLLLAVFLPCIDGIALQKKPLTNDDIVKMVKAELPEDTIVLVIQSSPGEYDTSPQALIVLKQQGATPKVLDAIIQSNKPASQSVPLDSANGKTQKVSAKNFTFELNSCKRFSEEIRCSLTITNDDSDDRTLGLIASRGHSADSRLLDQAGTEYLASDAQLGSRVGPYPRLELVSNVLTKVSVTFENISPETNSIRLLRLSCWTSHPTRKMRNQDFSVDFRDVGLDK